jgi:hypothetical protein
MRRGRNDKGFGDFVSVFAEGRKTAESD